jgi:hypothetical protein
MSNGHYPSPNVAYQSVHALIGYGAVVTAAFRLHHWASDKALYEAEHRGRNRVSGPPQQAQFF